VAAHAALARHFGPTSSACTRLRQVQRLPDRGPPREGPRPPQDRWHELPRSAAHGRRGRPAFFRAVYAFARERYDTTRRATTSRPSSGKRPRHGRARGGPPRPPRALPRREILHVTFGSVLKEVGADGKLRFKDTLFGLLRSNPSPTPTTSSATSSSTSGPSCHDRSRSRHGFLPVEEVKALAREGLARLPSTAVACSCSSPTARARCRCRSSSTCSTRRWGRARPRSTSWWLSAPRADERRAALATRRPAGGRRACRPEAHLQPPLGRPGGLRDARDDPGGRDRAAQRRPPEPRRDRRAQQAAARVRPRDRLRPVFPHEVVGFSGGTKYLFPGIAGPEIIHFTHWLGALISNYEIIGTKATPSAP